MKDTTKILKALAFGGLALYLWSLHRKQGTSLLAGDPAPGSGFRFRLNHEKIIQSALPLMDVKPEHEPVVRFALTEFLNGFTKR